MLEFSPDTCPVGITNAKNIENLGDHFDMAIERLTEKVGELKEEVTSLSKNMDEKFEGVDKRFDSMEKKFKEELTDIKNSIPQTVDTKISEKRGKAAVGAWKYLLVGILIPIGVAIVVALLKVSFGL